MSGLSLFPQRALGRLFVRSATAAWLAPWTLARHELMRRLDDVLVGSLLLVGFAIAFVGAAMADQAASQAMRLLGDLSFIGPEYIVLGFEEYGPLVVALTFAARVGAGFAAEVATLKGDETIDALEVVGVDLARTRFGPMGLACVVGCVALGLLSVAVWEGAGILVMVARHGSNPYTFFRPDAVALHSVVLCVLKNLGFGAIVFATSLAAGLRAPKGTEGTGVATTEAVVFGLVLCLAYNLVVDIAWFLVKGPA